MKRRMMAVLALVLAVSLPGASRAEENWPQWRGPHGDGTSKNTDLPTTWSLEQNVVWKTDLPAWSGGTPVIWGDRIFLTSPSKSAAAAAPARGAGQEPAQPTAQQTPAAGNFFAQPEPQPQQESARGQGGRPGGRGPGGRRGRGGDAGRDPGGQSLLLMCLSRKDGTPLWERELDTGNAMRNKGNATSPSPVTDGQHVWAVSGNGVIVAFDMAGNELWKRKLQEEYGAFDINWGYASSPLLYEGKLIVQNLQGVRRSTPSYVIAYNALTGVPDWKIERPTDAPGESHDAYTTPAVLKIGGQTQIVISGGDYVTGHDPANGAELWRVSGLNPRAERNYRIIASPVVVGDMILAPTRKTPLLALQAESPNKVSTRWPWTKSGGTDVPTPVSDGKYMYMVDETGLVSCTDLKTGETVWGPQRSGLGTVWSSPLLADGKIYIINENAETIVLAAGPEYKVLATNILDASYTLSTPVVSGKQLFIRTGAALYCIGEKATP